eukprot:TRINITY_DN5381_c0_g1_i1.p1 TRINITY_DN5381_c0_g1~~TRINITY_DN5381_c0_g1_i1.p1  ORF type:complete len:214 (-),score=45.44 TRINITY_DN5381_c0_g1_i1:94-735(-)
MDNRENGKKIHSIDAKIVLLGDSAVGKTSFALRYVDDVFSSSSNPTIGASFLTKRLTIKDFKIKLQIWDTAGQERFRSLAPMYYRGAIAAILVYDITNSESFEQTKSWVEELKSNLDDMIILVLVGNKKDLHEIRSITFKEGKEYAESINAMFFETSAKLNEGIDEVFLEISKKLLIICAENINWDTNLSDSNTKIELVLPGENNNSKRENCC